MNMIARLRFELVVLCLISVLAPHLGAAPYTFTRIAASPGDVGIPSTAPALNNLGQVAFDGLTTMGAPEARILRGAGGALTVVASPSGSAVMPTLVAFTSGAYALNDAGQVGFSAYNDAPGSGVYRSDGTTFVVLDDSTDPNIYPSINGAGTLAFRMSTVTGLGIFFGSSSSLTMVVEAGGGHFYSAVGNPAINDSGTLAFTAREQPPMGGGFPVEHIFTSTPGGMFTEVVNSTTGGWSTFGTAFADSAVLSNSGAVAFEGMKSDGSEGVYLATPGAGSFTLTTIADTTGPYASFDFNALSGLSINSTNRVAFRATLDGSGTAGIFTGPDPVADKVVAVGDTIDGKVVESIQFGRFALNDAGEVAFFATFTSVSGGGGGVYRASPATAPPDFGPVTQESFLLRSDAAPTDPDHAMFSVLRPPMINGAGKLTFKGMVFPRDPTDLDPNAITGANDLAIWADKGSTPLAMIARESGAAAGIGGGVYSNFSDPIMSDAGEVAFKATLKTGTAFPGFTGANNEVIYSDAPGLLTKVARKGDLLPAIAPAAAWKTFNSLAVVDGGCFGTAMLSGLTTANDMVFWAWDAGDLEPHFPLREGAVLSFGAAGSRTISGIDLLNAKAGVAGQGRSYSNGGPTAWVRSTFVGGGVVLLKFTSGAALFDTMTPGPKILPAVTGSPAAPDAAPGVTGALFGSINSPATNAQGHIAFSGTFKTRAAVAAPVPLAAITMTNDAAIWAGAADALAVVAREGSAAPDAGGALFSAFADPVLDDNDRVAFVGTLKSDTALGITSANNKGIWADTGSGLKLIARTGTTAAWLPTGAVIASFTSMAINQRGGLFKAKLKVGVGGVTSARDDILSVWRGLDGTATRVFRERDYVEVFPGHLRRLLTVDVLTAAPSPVAGVGRSFNSSGQTMTYCTFIDGTTGFIGIDL